MSENERQFLENARQVLDGSVRDLDGATRSRLAQARNAALDTRKRTRRRLLAWGTPAAGLAAAAIVGMLTLGGNGGITDVPAAETYVADLEMLTSEESLEFYENIEFYEWLSEVENEDDVSRGLDIGPALVAARPRAGGAALVRCDGDGKETGLTEPGDARISRLV